MIRRTRLSQCIAAAILVSGFNAGAVLADAKGGSRIAPLKPDVPYVFVVHNGRSIRVERNINDSFIVRSTIRSVLSHQSDTCPPFCLTPINLELPVDTFGEAEMIDFMLNELREDTGTLVDIRNPRDYDLATIPGSVSHFIQKIQKGVGDEEFDAMLESFGAKRHDGIDFITQVKGWIGLQDTSMMTSVWDFSDARTLVIWTNSSLEKSPAIAIEKLLEAGYPAGKLKWYRGGMAAWQFWGFNTVSKPKR